ncbi:O-antigen ligase family protein [Qipengyuania gaetbuli]|uniref:O-antigen ligase family protein n=1 Tax=Qipengyuania gaetbuli TaxID=266952 RepID=UPI001CD70CBB|nr:O-antigen ligase family protein [Qipengyuania gaetbuli]MCA0911017.1 O-antigen ligase family protein [Qipengyuania gaetbuli]
MDVMVGLEVWRPLTLSPAATINALASLVVPLAVLLLLCQLGDSERALAAFVVMGVVSTLVGVLQLFSDPRSGLYLYEITNRGSPVGLFANRNHQAVFLACCALICTHLALRSSLTGRKNWVALYASCGLLLGVGVLINGSRAGLFALLMVMIMSAAVLLPRRAEKAVKTRAKGQSFLAPVALALAAVALIALFALAERLPALSRLIERSALEDLRADLLPILLEMVADFQPWGTGLGTFEHAYRMREPVELLMPSYVNEAHNDWLQFVIEAGVPGLLVMAAAITIALVRVWRMVGSLMQARGGFSDSWLGLGLLLILAGASVVDYPLRVPSIMALAICALAIFVCPDLSKQAKAGKT